MEENKRGTRQLFLVSKWKSSNRSRWESCTLWGHSLCISISYSSQTDNPALCSQGQEGHTIPRAMTTHRHTHTYRVLESTRYTLWHSYTQRARNALPQSDTNTHWHRDTQRHFFGDKSKYLLQFPTTWNSTVIDFIICAFPLCHVKKSLF